jgi:hypothetical protein
MVIEMRNAIAGLIFAAMIAAAAGCASQPSPANPYAGPITSQEPPASSLVAAAQPPCTVNAVKICQDNARDRPALFFPDAVKGQSAANPSNLMAFAAPLQIPGGPMLKVACYYRPGTMAVVYARAWALAGGNQLVDLNPQAGQVLNSPGAPSSPPLTDRDYRFLRERGYCAPPP